MLRKTNPKRKPIFASCRRGTGSEAFELVQPEFSYSSGMAFQFEVGCLDAPSIIPTGGCEDFMNIVCTKAIAR